MRSLPVQQELVSRVEAAGGQVLAVDVGASATAARERGSSGTMLGAVAEYQRRTSAERSGEAQARAVARGVPPWPNVTPGYMRGDDAEFYPDPVKAPVVEQAFEMRASGSTVKEVQAFLRAHDIDVSYHGTTLLCSRVVLGEIHFGKLVNLTAHAAIVDADLWRAVQRVKVSRGRRAKSERLLARLGVLRCGSCGARMVVGTSSHGGTTCIAARRRGLHPPGDDQRRDRRGRRLRRRPRRARRRRGPCQRRAGDPGSRAGRYAGAGRLGRRRRGPSTGFGDETSVRERLGELRAELDGARDHHEGLGGLRAAVTVNAVEDWDRLSPTPAVP